MRRGATDPFARRGARYEVRGPLGKGGMATVVRAYDHVRQEVVAMKRLAPGVDTAALEREYRALKSLDHPRIIRVFDYGVGESGPFYTMELLDGKDLLQKGPLPWKATCQYLRDVATCLSLLHARHLLHRDVSARNVRMTADGRCKLIDFGALVDFGPIDTIVGTAPYVPPEALRAGYLDQRADLYSLGALAYRCLAGESAYPAPNIASLPEMWKRMPPRPSKKAPGVPHQLDELVMALLEQNPLARPSSAAEVITRLDAMVELRGDDEGEQRSLAQSFLSTPKFVGRALQMAELEASLRYAVAGHGRALRIVGPPGSGRSRLLDEIAIRGQLAGATVIKTDASMQSVREGAIRALLQGLGATPTGLTLQSDRHTASEHALRLAEPPTVVVGRHQLPATEVWSRVPQTAPDGEPATTTSVGASPAIDQLLAASRKRPLVVLVDNVESADSASLAALVDMARVAESAPLLLVVTESSESGGVAALGLGPLEAACRTVTLDHLTTDETTALLRAVFGNATRIERLSEWLHAESGGSPLHTIELARYFVARGVIRHERGAWLLPQERPELLVSDALGLALRSRLDGLSPDARFLVESLALQELEPSLELCRLLAEGQDTGPGVFALLDELVAADVLQPVGTGYRFTSAAVRQTAVARLSVSERRGTHRALGHALLQLGGDQDLLRLQAGWHFIRGGDEMHGARMIARTVARSMAATKLLVNLYPAAAPVEAALMVYRQHRVPVRERMCLLSALAQAGYYAHYSWAQRYGDLALDAVEQAAGLRAARAYSRWLGPHLGLLLGLAIACIRHYLAPRDVRGGSFREVLIHAGTTSTALAGVAAIGLDGNRCERIAQAMSPFRVLPKRVSIHVGYRLCEGFTHLARENPVDGMAHFEELATRLDTPGYFWNVPDGVHELFIGACHFARGVFAMLQADSQDVLESAERLEGCGLPLYGMIASELRYMYHMNRGELELAQPHREDVELHAARMGSAWQVELWETVCLLPMLLITSDPVGVRQVADRLDVMSESVPSLTLYAELTRAALHGEDPAIHVGVARTAGHLPPRSYIGWSVVQAVEARAFNQRGEHEAAWRVCRHAMSQMKKGDRRFSTLFVMLDIQAAIAVAGLGHAGTAMKRLDRELQRHWHSAHPVVLGLLHEARARIAFYAGRRGSYLLHAVEAARWLRPTRHPGLIAIAERVAKLEASEQTETGLLLQIQRPEMNSSAEACTTLSVS